MELSLIDPRIEYLAIPKEFINDKATIKTSNVEPIFRHLIQRKIEAQINRHMLPQSANWFNNINYPKINSSNF
tara:strand:+ start:153 stop:371 length:219 start_codon:yes stop_codon:yes gene_type:complete